jgi:hypothetical protein
MPSPSRWTLAATILASSMTFIDGTVVNVALPALQADSRDNTRNGSSYALFLEPSSCGRIVGRSTFRKRDYGVTAVLRPPVGGIAPSPTPIAVSGFRAWACFLKAGVRDHQHGIR